MSTPVDGTSNPVASASLPLSDGSVNLNNQNSFFDVGEYEEPDDFWKPNMSGNESIKVLQAENEKLRQELESAENQINEFQANMPAICDELESKTNHIQYLQNALESSQKKYEILHEQQKKLELKMSWTDQDMQEQLNLISDGANAEVEGVKERLFQELSRLNKELSIESHERSVLVNDLVLVKQQLSKLRKDKDDEREAYILNGAELERALREANREKHKLRITIVDMREHIFNLETELEKQKGLVAEKEQWLQTQEQWLQTQEKELYHNNPKNPGEKRASVTSTIIPGNLAVELSHNENVIAELRQEKMNAEDDVAEYREQLERTLELIESAFTTIAPDNKSEGKLQLENAIAQTREFLGLEPLPKEEEVPEPEVVKEERADSYDDVNNFDDLILERKEIGRGLDEVDLLDLSASEPNAPIKVEEEVSVEPEISPKYDQMQEFKVEVVNEVSKMHQVILEEFKQIAQEHLRTSVVEETLMDTIQNSTQDSAKAVIDWMERDRRSVAQAHESESATEMERIKKALQVTLEDQQKTHGVVVERLWKKMADLEQALKNSNSEVEALRKQRQKDAAERLRLKAKICNTMVDELKIAAVTQHFAPERVLEEEDVVRVHRLNTMAGMSTNLQRECVTKFLSTYSNPSNFQTFRDPQLHTTIYMFEFDGTMWKTRISFLYPFVLYMTQVIGVNKKALGSVFVILPTSTVSIKINRLSNSFSNMQRTLEIHNSDGLWNYIFIFLKNVSTHYGSIKRYVGSRTRQIRSRDERRRLEQASRIHGPAMMQRSVTDSAISTSANKSLWAEQKRSTRNPGQYSSPSLYQGEKKMESNHLVRRATDRKPTSYPLKSYAD